MSIQLHPEVKELGIRLIDQIETQDTDLLWHTTSVPVLIRSLLNGSFNLVVLHDRIYIMELNTPLYEFLKVCNNIQKLDIMAIVKHWDIYTLLHLSSAIRMPLLLSMYGEGKQYIPPASLKFQKLLPRQVWEKVRGMIRLGLLKDASDDPKPKHKMPVENQPKKSAKEPKRKH